MAVRIVQQLEFTSPRTGLCVASAEWVSFLPAKSAFRGYGIFRLRLLSGSTAVNTSDPGWVFTGGNIPPNTTVDQVGPDGFDWCTANFVVRQSQIYTLRLEQQIASTNFDGTMQQLVLKARVYKR